MFCGIIFFSNFCCFFSFLAFFLDFRKCWISANKIVDLICLTKIFFFYFYLFLAMFDNFDKILPTFYNLNFFCPFDFWNIFDNLDKPEYVLPILTILALFKIFFFFQFQSIMTILILSANFVIFFWKLIMAFFGQHQ